MKSTKSLVAGACGALAVAWVCGAFEANAAERPLAGAGEESNFIPSCEPGQQQGGKRFCVSKEKQQKREYDGAIAECGNQGARVCTSQDLLDLHSETELDAQYDPNGAWLGDPMIDGVAPCGIASIVDGTFDFVGACDATQPREYWCCSDL